MKIYLCKSCILLFGLTLFNNPAISQNKFEISGGAGFPELINLKIKYGGNFKIALCQSIFPMYDAPIPLGPTTVEVYYHFTGKSKFVEERTWYLQGGLGCFWGSIKGGFTGDQGTKFCFYPRIGRSFYFSNRTGINLDAGAFVPFFDFFDITIYPSLSINFFIRL